jgi:FkbM family methyltransferase
MGVCGACFMLSSIVSCDRHADRRVALELYENSDPAFTRWVVEAGLLSSSFVVIDIGCQGGEHTRWRWLGDQLELHGFDALEEAVRELQGLNQRATNKHFYNLALGNEDGERELFIQQNAYATSVYEQGDNSRMSVDASTYTNSERRRVPIRKLDSLFAEGLLTRADFIKLDCEGFEPEILKGAQQFLRTAKPIGVETETSFHVSPVLPRTHIFAVNETLIEHKLVLFDLAFSRVPRSSFAAALGAEHGLAFGQPATFNILFARDLVTERDFPMSYLVPPIAETASADMVIKSAILFELYGLVDCAYEVIAQFAAALPASFDVEKALALLCNASGLPDTRTPSGANSELNAVYNSTSWRITAPMRAIRRRLSAGSGGAIAPRR